METRNSSRRVATITMVAAMLLAAPAFVAPARAIPICSSGTDCRSALITDANALIDALRAGTSERNARSPIVDLNEAIFRLQQSAPAQEAIAYCTGAAKEDDRALKKLARAVKSCEKLVAKGQASPDIFGMTVVLVDDMLATVTQNADELEGIVGPTSQLSTARQRLAGAQAYRDAFKLAKAADQAQRAYDAIREPGCDASIRSCTVSFQADVIDSDESTDYEFDASPDARECSVVAQVNGSTVSTQATTCEDDAETLDYDFFVDNFGMGPGDTFTVRILRTNGTEACSASLTLFLP